MKADLHTHTTHSDGVYTTSEILTMASNKGIDVIAITDHDTVQDVSKNQKKANELGITYIPGIELSTLYNNKSVHVLGYFVDDSYKAKTLQDYYKKIKTGREKRAKQFIKNLKKYYSISISYDEVYEMAHGLIARPHIARTIAKHYPQYTVEYIFDNFVGDHTKAYVPSTKLSLKEGIELLKEHNCMVVLAHPTLVKSYMKDDVLAYDYDGIEARYFRNKPGEEQLFKNLAKKRGMVTTGGSDFHGYENDENHGEIGLFYIEGDDVKTFLNEYKKRKNNIS